MRWPVKLHSKVWITLSLYESTYVCDLKWVKLRTAETLWWVPLVRVPQRHRRGERESGTYIYRNNYRGQEVPWFSIWKLENWENHWCNSVWVWRPEQQGSQWCETESQGLKIRVRPVGQVKVHVWKPENREHWYPKAEKGGWPSSSRKSKLVLPLLFCSIQVPNHWKPPTHISEGDLFTQSTKLDANLFWKHIHRHTRKQCVTSYLGIPEPSQVNTQINILHTL